eukprot:symbB.v1.2.029675.t1/scaffold3280.1/size59835/2
MQVGGAESRRTQSHNPEGLFQTAKHSWSIAPTATLLFRGQREATLPADEESREGGSANASAGNLQSQVRRQQSGPSASGTKQQIASNESLKLAWTKSPSSSSLTSASPTRSGRREHCFREGRAAPRRNSLEKPSQDEDQAKDPDEEAPTEEEERALALLQRSNFFKTLEPSVLAELPRLATFIEAPKGAVVFRQGDPPCNCWLIAKGEVGFYVSHATPASPRLATTPGCEHMQVPLPWEEKARVRTLDGNSTFSLQSNLGKSVNKGRSGAVFGELALMEEACRKATAKCHTNCEFVTLPAAAFKIAKERLLQFRAAKKRFLDKYVPSMKDCPEPGPNDPPHPSFFFNKLRVHQEYFFLKQGEKDSRALYVIYKGNVELRREKENSSQVCQKLLPGSMFGSWIQHAVEPLSAVASTPCEVWYVKASDIKELPEPLLRTIQHHLSVEYAKLLKSVYVERAFGWNNPPQRPLTQNHDLMQDDSERWAEQVLNEVQDQEMRTQFFAARIGHDLINRKWR